MLDEIKALEHIAARAEMVVLVELNRYGLASEQRLLDHYSACAFKLLKNVVIPKYLGY